MSTIRTRMAALVPDLAEGRWAPEDDPTYGAVAGAHQDLRKELWQHLKAAGEVLKQLDNIKGGNNPPLKGAAIKQDLEFIEKLRKFVAANATYF